MCLVLYSVLLWFTLREERFCIGERTQILICSMFSKETKEAKNNNKNYEDISETL